LSEISERTMPKALIMATNELCLASMFFISE
jgi:hypothetical protein